jgi:hypothetical protein
MYEQAYKRTVGIGGVCCNIKNKVADGVKGLSTNTLIDGATDSIDPFGLYLVRRLDRHGADDVGFQRNYHKKTLRRERKHFNALNPRITKMWHLDDGHVVRERAKEFGCLAKDGIFGHCTKILDHRSRFLATQRFGLHHGINVASVPCISWHAACRRVWMRNEATFFEIGHHVSDGGRTKRKLALEISREHS